MTDETPIADGQDDDPNPLPAFLRRNPDNSLPDIRPEPQTVRVSIPATTLAQMDDSTSKDYTRSLRETYSRESHAAVATEIAALAKQKSYGRLAKMKAKQSDKAAAKAGKTWDPNKAEWV